MAEQKQIIDSETESSDKMSIKKIADIGEGDGVVMVAGHVTKIQMFKKFAFLTVRDKPATESHIQMVCDLKFMKDLLIESYVLIKGQVKKLPPKQHSHKTFEIHVLEMSVIGTSDSDYPARCPLISGPEVRQTERHLWLRTQGFALLTIIRSLFLRSIRTTLEKMGCIEITPPLIVGTECEGGASTFKFDCQGQVAFLTQSSQFYLEMALPGVGDCYCIADSFRAEKSHTRRHFIEFLHAEAEFSGIFTMDDHIQKMREFLQTLLVEFQTISAKTIKDYDTVMKTDITSHLASIVEKSKRIKCMRHSEAIKYLREHEIYKDAETKTHFELDDDIPEAQERKMIDDIGEIVFLTHFPLVTKSFYMKADPEDPTLAWGLDVEVPTVGEIIGSGVREGDYKTLLSRMAAQSLKIEDYTEYLDLRKYGFASTSGFGLGVDRILTWIMDQYRISDVATFPRYPGHLRP